MTPFDEQDLHRLVKQAVDSGAAETIAEATARFGEYRLELTIDGRDAENPDHQAALLTAVALARRVFLGGVRVSGPLDTAVSVPLPCGSTLADAISELGGLVGSPGKGDRPRVTIGSAAMPRAAAFHVRPVYSGWRGGVVPADAEGPVPTSVMSLAPMLAAALTVSEAFTHVAEKSPIAGRRPVGLSLWSSDTRRDWLTEDDGAPTLEVLPSRLWLIGLGHLGQAYLWALGLLPYDQPDAVELVLQDTDRITRSTESTSILTDSRLVETKKTRAMAAWAERRGFRTTICERAFDVTHRRQETDPTIALCGVDNPTARRALEHAGFALVVEAGLGRGHRDFRRLRVHTLPASRTAAEIWKQSTFVEDVSDRSGYQRLLAEGALDRCGITMLAGKAIGAPFVGAVAGALVVAEVLKLLHGGTIDELVDLDLESVEFRSCVPQRIDFSGLNPGFVRRVTSDRETPSTWATSSRPPNPRRP